MKKKWLLVIILSMSSLSAGCSFWDGIRGCPDGQIDWTDALMMNDIKYGSGFIHQEDTSLPETGDSLGKVSYMLDGHACSSHKLKNGEATYVSVGTPVYEVVGYQPEFRVIADGRVFQVIDNPNAETLSDLADIEGKVTKISIRRDEDDTLLGELDPEQTKEFLKEYLSLPYKGDIDPKNENNRHARVLIYFQLEDGTTFHTIYILDENIIGYDAFGNEKMKGIIESVVNE
ncbi:hypothetical protein DVB69_00310 [Sporosarcina sp. BI001-red]|uniref:hypothetical protein n=1 Tax=Sporosarcina sp. BI001-red TaxID=2282866 RepID=UPI000E2691F7|nr:hypothetical protein [Sporosarcina sp. BI001-red]REB11622.1 hypothetical protein DVB69_00310 [Sporosarcina sp. BI001-red]